MRNESQESRRHANVLDTNISPVDDAFGPVESGSLIVQCSLCYLTVSSQRDISPDGNSRRWNNFSTINGVSITCNCDVSLDHPSPAILAAPTSLSFHSIPVENLFDKIRRHHTTLTRLLLHQTQGLRGQYYRVGLITTSLYGADSHVVSSLKRRENSDTTCYLDNESNDLCAIELI